jgi:hypothetical protein
LDSFPTSDRYDSKEEEDKENENPTTLTDRKKRSSIPSWILQPNPNNKRHREKAPDRSYENEKENPKQEHRKT